MEVDQPRRRPADLDAPADMADEVREVVREAADEPRRVFGDPMLLVAPADERGPLPYDPDLAEPAQEEADEPRKLP
jgi:hypothetical protein